MDDQHGIAVIGDLVGSRVSGDRGEVQRGLVGALESVNVMIEPLQPLAPTIGDEFQGVFGDLASALRATLLVRLALPEGLDARCGVGAGTLRVVGRSEFGLSQDGPAWWAARNAIDEAKRRESGKHQSLRTWFAAAPGTDGPAVPVVNAFLLCRDQIMGSLSARHRRMLLGSLLGRTQRDIAEDEGITQSAVSQGLRHSGAMAVVAALEVLGSEEGA